MLKVSLHAGQLATRNASNQLAVLDIAYAKQEALADYLVALSLRGVGEVAPDMVTNYPRWSASVWDLTARALTRVCPAPTRPPAPACRPALCLRHRTVRRGGTRDPARTRRAAGHR